MLQNELKRKEGAEKKRDKNRIELLEESKTCVKLNNIFKNVEKRCGDCRVGSLKIEVIVLLELGYDRVDRYILFFPGRSGYVYWALPRVKYWCRLQALWSPDA
jgi:hypothetical protein